MEPLPIGSIIGYANNHESRPRGYLACDGSKIYQDEYPKLVGGVVPVSGVEESGLRKRIYGYLPELEFGFGKYPNAIYKALLFDSRVNGTDGGSLSVGDNVVNILTWANAIGSGIVRQPVATDENVFYISPIGSSLEIPAFWSGLIDGTGAFYAGPGGSLELQVEVGFYSSAAIWTKVRVQYLDYSGIWQDIATQSGLSQYHGTVTLGGTASCSVLIGPSPNADNISFVNGSGIYRAPKIVAGLGSFGENIYRMQLRVVQTSSAAVPTNGRGIASYPNTSNDIEMYAKVCGTYISSVSPVVRKAYIRGA